MDSDEWSWLSDGQPHYSMGSYYLCGLVKSPSSDGLEFVVTGGEETWQTSIYNIEEQSWRYVHTILPLSVQREVLKSAELLLLLLLLFS